MKLGTETGSLVNHLLANENYVKPEVGMDVTEFHWSDRTAWRIVEVDKDLKGCTLQRYEAKLIVDETHNYYTQDYKYEDENGNPLLGEVKMHIRYKYKNWKDGSITKNLRFGYRSQYEDPSF